MGFPHWFFSQRLTTQELAIAAQENAQSWTKFQKRVILTNSRRFLSAMTNGSSIFVGCLDPPSVSWPLAKLKQLEGYLHTEQEIRKTLERDTLLWDVETGEHVEFYREFADYLTFRPIHETKRLFLTMRKLNPYKTNLMLRVINKAIQTEMRTVPRVTNGFWVRFGVDIAWYEICPWGN